MGVRRRKIYHNKKTKNKLSPSNPQTGYFVCSYLVLCNNLSPSEALENFADARGHQIERPNYISAITHHHTNEALKRIVGRIHIDDQIHRQISSHRLTSAERRHAPTTRTTSRFDVPTTREGNFRGQIQGRMRDIHSRDFRNRSNNNSGPRVGQMGNIVRPNHESHYRDSRYQVEQSRDMPSRTARRLHDMNRTADDNEWNSWVAQRMRR